MSIPIRLPHTWVGAGRFRGWPWYHAGMIEETIRYVPRASWYFRNATEAHDPREDDPSPREYGVERLYREQKWSRIFVPRRIPLRRSHHAAWHPGSTHPSLKIGSTPGTDLR